MYTILLYTNTIIQCNVVCDGYNVMYCVMATMYVFSLLYEIHKI